MIRALYTSATGMNAQQTNIDVISNNLANVNTTGYKSGRAEFQDLIYQYVLEPGAKTSDSTQNPTGIQVGLGVKTSSVQKVFMQGDLKNTDRNLDVAIQGEGFFKVIMPNGDTAYTRTGSFKLDKDGKLVTADGYELDPSITVPDDTTSISISENGIVSITQPGSASMTDLGQLTAVRFPNQAGLKAMGQNLYLESASSGAPSEGVFSENGFGTLNQGFLETSNVSVVEQVVNMITAQRAYEASSKGITTADDMINLAINMKR
ncbi:MAG: flagellar basal-body rod protein FlgG [Bdellovibrionota bacterium]